ncbi:MAG: hypothetical protein U9Q07_07240, partial [Planctomycetota bacterium]|nr:hypothetical protein [Planctomycetota bacterium]
QVDAITGSGGTMTPTVEYAESAPSLDAYEYTTAGDTWIPLRYDTNDNIKVAHKFTTAAGSTPTFVTVRFKLYQAGTVAASKYIWATIEADSSGPDGTAITTSYKILANSITTSTSGEWVTFTFREVPALSASTVYYVVLQGDWTVNTTNHIKCHVDTVTSGGTVFLYDSAWANVGTQSLHTDCEQVASWTAVTPANSAFTARTATIEDVQATAHEFKYIDARVYGPYVHLVMTKSGTVSTALCSAYAVKTAPQYAD